MNTIELELKFQELHTETLEGMFPYVNKSFTFEQRIATLLPFISVHVSFGINLRILLGFFFFLFSFVFPCLTQPHTWLKHLSG